MRMATGSRRAKRKRPPLRLMDHIFTFFLSAALVLLLTSDISPSGSTHLSHTTITTYSSRYTAEAHVPEIPAMKHSEKKSTSTRSGMSMEGKKKEVQHAHASFMDPIMTGTEHQNPIMTTTHNKMNKDGRKKSNSNDINESTMNAHLQEENVERNDYKDMRINDTHADENGRKGLSMEPLRQTTDRSIKARRKVQDECPDANNATVYLVLTTDYYPYETSWDIKDIDGNLIAADDTAANNPNTEYDYTYCLDASGCYVFTLYDYYSDGIGCDLDSCFSVSYEGSEILSGSTFDTESYASGYFGDGCPSSAPSAYLNPTSSPQPTTSLSPTGICGDTKTPLYLVSRFKTVRIQDIFWDIYDQTGMGLTAFESGRKYPTVDCENTTDYEISATEVFCLDSDMYFIFSIHDYAEDLKDSTLFSGKDCVAGYDSGIKYSLYYGDMDTLIGEEERFLGCEASQSTFLDGTVVDSCDGNDEAFFRIDLVTDEKGIETSWDVRDIDGNVLLSSYSATYGKKSSSTHSFCLAKDGCYKFSIYDSEGDGICCGAYGEGEYEIYYNDALLKKGGEFEFLESTIFGDGCLSTPSPSNSTIQSSSPTLSPAPSTTIHQTSKPATDVIYVDHLGRREFPLREARLGNTTVYNTLPNCSLSNQHVGCINHPMHNTIPSPPWAGKLHPNHIPECTTSIEDEVTGCDSALPMSQSVGMDLVEDWEAVELYHFDTACPFLPVNVSKPLVVSKCGEFIEGDTNVIAVGDLNGDLRVDIVYGNAIGGNNEILYMNDKGGFEIPVSLPGGYLDTMDIKLADLDHDGLLDIVAANSRQPNQVFFNKGDGNFSVAFLPGGNMPTEAVALADIDHDGAIDIIFGNGLSKPNVILYNDGHGGFLNVEVLPGGNRGTQDIKAGDIDGDGKIDIVIANDGPNQILYNRGNRKFHLETLPSSARSDSREIELGDVDGDSLVDIVVASSLSACEILYNKGMRQFDRAELPGPDGVQVQSLSIADFDGNGLLDLIFGVHEDDLTQDFVLYNKGGRNFYVDSLPLPFKIFTTSIATYDFNNDGFVDIVIANGGTTIDNECATGMKDLEFAPNLILYNNQKKVTKYEEQAISLPLNEPNGLVVSESVALGDVNQDGLLDIFRVNTNGSQVILNLGEGQFEAPLDLPSRSIRGSFIEIGDLDNDGALDVIIASFRERNQILYSTVNNGDFDFEDAVDLPGATATDTRVIKIADLNNDGRWDVIMGNKNNVNEIILNEGVRSFGSPVTLPGESSLDTRSIAFGDFNGDGMIDIVVGNSNGANQILYNKGDGTSYDLHDLVNTSSDPTRGVTTGDLDKDGNIDIVWVNRGFPVCEVLFNNGDGTFYKKPIKAAGSGLGSLNGQSVALSDINDDGFLDIIIGYGSSSNYIFYNNGNRDDDGTTDFLVGNSLVLPGGELFTVDIAAGDVDGDGYIDLVFASGKEKENDQVLFFSTCPMGGARLHSSSLCFKCPNFMGRTHYLTSSVEQSLCKECLPDHEQNVDNEICSVEPCFIESRPFGTDECRSCNAGTYYKSNITRLEKDDSTWTIPRCTNCEAGTYSTDALLAIDKCFDCVPGSYQNEIGMTECNECATGYFQEQPGQASCDACALGGFCDAIDTCGGGFTPCPPGTYNDLPGQKSVDACIPCPPGTYSTEVGANSSDLCLPCNPGEFSNETGQTFCYSCERGSYQPDYNQTSCLKCKAGTYADNVGFINCIDCPYRLSSLNGSSTCPFCDKNFYLNDTTVDTLTLFRQPLRHCLDCPGNGTCPTNTTLQTIGVPRNFWRDSFDTSELYECKADSTFCEGMTTEDHQIMLQKQDGNQNPNYCAEGYEGLLCEVCSVEGRYFNRFSNSCDKCVPISETILRVFLLILAVLVVVTVLSLVYNRFQRVRNIVSDLSLQAKLKVLVSFLQLVYTFHEDVNDTQGIYGIQLDSELLAWLSFLQYISLDIFRLISLPIECIGSMVNRVVISATWPYVAVLLIVGGQMIVQFIFAVTKAGNIGVATLRESFISVIERARESKWSGLLYTTIFLFYFVLPIVSMSIFEVINCEAFKTKDDPAEYKSYLIIDPTIVCDSNLDSQYASLLNVFWGFFVLWPVLTPIMFIVLLLLVRGSVRSKRITPLANACRFLWGDYTESMYFWDVMETIKRIFLSGFIMFVDRKEGSNKILRLIIAVVICTLYMGILTLARPYRRTDDLYFAFVSNYSLICYFGLGIILHFCEDDDTCERFIGLSLSSYSASVLVVLLILSMTFLSIFLLLVIGFNTIRSPILRLAHSKEVPNLELPVECFSHVYMSYLPETGGDKAQSLSLKLKVFLPEILISFNVDEMGNETPLQQSIAESAVFIIVYSQSYFKSNQAQDEIRYAMKTEKPIVVVYEGSENLVETMKEECAEYCYDEDHYSSDEVLSYVFQEEPILWLNNTGVFTATSLNLIYRRILSYLPFYKENPNELQYGLKVPGEIKTSTVKARLKIYVCDENIGSHNIAQEMKEMISEGSKKDFIEIENYVSARTLARKRRQLEADATGANQESSKSNTKAVSFGMDEDPKQTTSRSSSNTNKSSKQAHDDTSGSFAASLKNIFSGPQSKTKEDTKGERVLDSMQSIPSELSGVSSEEVDDNSTLASNNSEDLDNEEMIENVKGNVRKIFLLYLNSNIMNGIKNTALKSIIREVMQKGIRIVVVYDAADQTPFSFYWKEITKHKFDPDEGDIVAVPMFGSRSNDHRRTSLRKTLSGAFELSSKTLQGTERSKSSRRSIIGSLRSLRSRNKVWSLR